MEPDGIGQERENPVHEGKVKKMLTGIQGFDLITEGGLPLNRTTLVAGTAGSAKTVFAVQFLVSGIEQANEPGVFVTFEERPADICQNFASLGWDIGAYVEAGKWAFVDASPLPEQVTISGAFDFGGLMAQLERAVKRVKAKRVAIDSLGAAFAQFPQAAIVRHEIFRIANALREMGVTSVMTAERQEEYGEISRHGVEEFVADNVVILRNILEDEKRRRTVEALKFRGTSHHKGEYPFTVSADDGIVVIPLSAIELKQKSTVIRRHSGNQELDTMCGGGIFRDSIILVTGATGCGKTLMTTEFISGGARNGERCLLLAFEESRDQLFRNAQGWGVDFAQFERDGLLKVMCAYPESRGLEDHLIQIKKIIQEFKPERLAVDSLSALERVSTMKGYREFVVALTSFVKHLEVASLFTATTPTLVGGTSVTEAHISTITDSIILLRYVEMLGEMRRGIMVLKMRGSAHDKNIREFTIDGQGMHVGKAFTNITGILAGFPHQVPADEVSRIERMFQHRGGAASGT